MLMKVVDKTHEDLDNQIRTEYEFPEIWMQDLCIPRVAASNLKMNRFWWDPETLLHLIRRPRYSWPALVIS